MIDKKFHPRALRSLPLSVMMSGYLSWSHGNHSNRGTGSVFWASTLSSYIFSRHLRFYSTNVSPKDNGYRPYGFTLRRVTLTFRNFHPCSKFFASFLPELSAAFLFRLCCRAFSTGTVVISAVEVRTAASGHLPPTYIQIRATCTSAPLALALRLATVSQAA